MSTNVHDPFSNLVLDEEERMIEEALERGEFEESSDLQATEDMLKEAAKLYRQLQSTKPITLRINQLDLVKIKAKARRNNMPYQTLLGAIVHDFAENQKELKVK